MPNSKKDRVAIAGASGFVGKALLPAIKDRFELAALTRSPHLSKPEQIKCDLFSIEDAEKALAGARYAIYLVHSMMPSARLTQGNFRDMDLILADNFARAAKANHVEQILYLGGMVPRETNLSAHLTSRLEVEKTLRASGVPVTALRAGMIIGPGGSSFEIMTRLVRRLPAMICPQWTQNLTSPIYIQDVVDLLSFCVGNPQTYDETFDIAGPDTLSYAEMMRITAKQLGLRRRLVSVPLFSPRLSRLWVSVVTGAPKSLVKPLIQSLKTPMIPKNRKLETLAKLTPTPFREALRRSLAQEEKSAPVAFRGHKASKENTVRSVQRIPMPPGVTVDMMAREYLQWLHRWFGPLIRVDLTQKNHADFRLNRPDVKLLTLKLNADRSHLELRTFDIKGGALVKTGVNGYLEFRKPLGQQCILSAIHEYRPRLPWYLYRATQAWFHIGVMRAFGNYIVSPQFAAMVKVNVSL